MAGFTATLDQQNIRLTPANTEMTEYYTFFRTVEIMTVESYRTSSVGFFQRLSFANFIKPFTLSGERLL